MYWKARARAKEFGRDFDIELNDIVIPEACPILGIPLYRNSGAVGPNSPVLDRINNDSGYVKGNVSVISHRANALKKNFTIQDIEALLNYMKVGQTWAETH